jgi:hypothetical protein
MRTCRYLATCQAVHWEDHGQALQFLVKKIFTASQAAVVTSHLVKACKSQLCFLTVRRTGPWLIKHIFEGAKLLLVTFHSTANRGWRKRLKSWFECAWRGSNAQHCARSTGTADVLIRAQLLLHKTPCLIACSGCQTKLLSVNTPLPCWALSSPYINKYCYNLCTFVSVASRSMQLASWFALG